MGFNVISNRTLDYSITADQYIGYDNRAYTFSNLKKGDLIVFAPMHTAGVDSIPTATTNCTLISTYSPITYPGSSGTTWTRRAALYRVDADGSVTLTAPSSSTSCRGYIIVLQQ